MADQTAAPAPSRTQSSPQGVVARLLAATELDTRLLGMIGALVIIWVGFHLLSGGIFLTPRNLWNLSVQTSEVGVMATGMVLVIVTRNIDLSVGAILAFVGVTMGVVQAQTLRFDSYRETGVPDTANLRVGPFYSDIAVTLAAGYRYVRTSAARPMKSPMARPLPRWTRRSNCSAAVRQARSAPAGAGCSPPSPASP